MMIHVDLNSLIAIVTGVFGVIGGVVALLAYFKEKAKTLQVEGARVQIMEELRDKVTGLTDENSDLKTKLACHDTDIGKIGVKIEGMEKTLDDIKGTLNVMSEKIDRVIERH